MLDAVLTKRNVTSKTKITVKSCVATALLALAVLLPQFVHWAAGAAGGVRWLPMYLPVLIGGCILGWRWGLGVGVLSPVVSFLLTLTGGNPMPASARLPYMIAELAVFAVIAGLFEKKIASNAWMAFPAVLLAAVTGRGVFLLAVALFQSVSPLSVHVVWAQIQDGLSGLVLQAVIVPFAVMGLSRLLQCGNRENNFDKQNV